MPTNIKRVRCLFCGSRRLIHFMKPVRWTVFHEPVKWICEYKSPFEKEFCSNRELLQKMDTPGFVEDK